MAVKPSVFHWGHRGKPHNGVYVGRPSRWGNRFRIGVHGTREEVIQRFRESLTDADRAEIRASLHGNDLGCWCWPEPCHADILLEIANEKAGTTDVSGRTMTIRDRRLRKNGLLVVDVETDGFDPHFGKTPFLLGAEFEDGRVWKFDLRRRDGGLCDDIMGRGHPKFRKLKRLIQSESQVKVAHNAKFEIRMLRAAGIVPRGPWWCTMNMCVLNDEYSQLSLKYLAHRHFGQSYEEKDLIDSWTAVEYRRRRNAYAKRGEPRNDAPEPTFEDYYGIHPAVMSAYLEDDLDNTMRLALMWRRPCTQQYGRGKVFKTETALVPVVATMEDEGIPINVGFCFDAGQRYEDLGNTNKMTLAKLEGDFPKHLLEYRADFKIGGWFRTFLKDCTSEGVIHPRFWQNGQNEGIKTGRFSITDPGFQTLPGGYRGTVGDRGKDVRRAVIARPGHYLFMLDYAQVEPRILAHYTQDRRMLEALDAGIDIYLAFVKIFFGNEPFKRKAAGDDSLLVQRRSDAKTIILAITYGMGIDKMARNLGVRAQVARGMRAKCFRRMPSMKELMNECMRQVARHGYIDDEVGRRYRVPSALSYKAINAIIQGLAAQVMKRALVSCMDTIGVWNGVMGQTDQFVRARQILTVHDEIIFEIPVGQEDELVPLLDSSMISVMPELSVPLKVDVSWGPFGGSWGDKVDWQPGDSSKAFAVKKSKAPSGDVAAVVGQIS